MLLVLILSVSVFAQNIINVSSQATVVKQTLPDEKTFNKKIKNIFGTPEKPIDSENDDEVPNDKTVIDFLSIPHNPIDVDNKTKDVIGKKDDSVDIDEELKKVFGTVDKPVNEDSKITNIFGAPENPVNAINEAKVDKKTQDSFGTPTTILNLTPVSTKSPNDIYSVADDGDYINLNENNFDDDDTKNDDVSVEGEEYDTNSNDDDLDDVDSNKNNEVHTKTDDFKGSNEQSPPAIDLPDGEKPIKSCVQRDGSPGVCVPYYYCLSEESQNIRSGKRLIDKWAQWRPCPKYMDVCCKPHQVQVTHHNLPEVNHRGCGYSNPGAGAFLLKTYGSVAQYGEFPWVVSILQFPATRFGSGSIIHPKVVLTSAHVVDMQLEQLLVRAGEWDFENNDEIYPYQEREVESIVIHENFDRRSRDNSVALLFLESPFDLRNAPHIGVACISRMSPFPGDKCFTTGWGSGYDGSNGDILNKVAVPWISRSQCRRTLRMLQFEFSDLPSSFSCGAGTAGVDACKADPGSPLVCIIGDEKEQRYAQFGVGLSDLDCGKNDGVPTLFENTARFTNWISARMRERNLDSSSFQYSIFETFGQPYN